MSSAMMITIFGRSPADSAATELAKPTAIRKLNAKVQTELQGDGRPLIADFLSIEISRLADAPVSQPAAFWRVTAATITSMTAMRRRPKAVRRWQEPIGSSPGEAQVACGEAQCWLEGVLTKAARL
ncbi:MAG: hypothetical protein WD294_01435 [Phycisphaeraceae bacterium]